MFVLFKTEEKNFLQIERSHQVCIRTNLHGANKGTMGALQWYVNCGRVSGGGPGFPVVRRPMLMKKEVWKNHRSQQQMWRREVHWTLVAKCWDWVTLDLSPVPSQLLVKSEAKSPQVETFQTMCRMLLWSHWHSSHGSFASSHSSSMATSLSTSHLHVPLAQLRRLPCLTASLVPYDNCYSYFKASSWWLPTWETTPYNALYFSSLLFCFFFSYVLPPRPDFTFTIALIFVDWQSY